MATELLLKKEDKEPLGINWLQKFLARHPDIKTCYIPPLDKERAVAEDPAIFNGWFELFQKTVEEHKICNKDIYNMDEKGFMQGVLGKVRVMVSKYERKAHMTQCGNLSLIECIYLDGRVLPP